MFPFSSNQFLHGSGLSCIYFNILIDFLKISYMCTMYVHHSHPRSLSVASTRTPSPPNSMPFFYNPLGRISVAHAHMGVGLSHQWPPLPKRAVTLMPRKHQVCVCVGGTRGRQREPMIFLFYTWEKSYATMPSNLIGFCVDNTSPCIFIIDVKPHIHICQAFFILLC